MSEKIYACLLRLYPSAFRSKYREEALQLYRDRLRDEHGMFSRCRLNFDLLIDALTGLPQAWGNRYTTADAPSLMPNADGVPSFRFLDKQPLQPVSILIGSTLSLAALSVIGLMMGLPSPSLSTSTSSRRSPIEAVMQRLNRAASAESNNQTSPENASTATETPQAQSPAGQPANPLSGYRPRFDHTERGHAVPPVRSAPPVQAAMLLRQNPEALRTAQPSVSAPNPSPTKPSAGGGSNMPRLEVVSVKESRGNVAISAMGVTNDGLVVTNVPLLLIVRTAFAGHFTNGTITGLPGWEMTRYDIEGKVSDSDVAILRDLNQPQRIEMLRGMLRSVLVDRFHMVYQDVDKVGPIYRLVVGKGGPKLRQAAPDEKQGQVDQRGAIKAPMSMSGLASVLSGPVTGRVVVDATGLQGTYDVKLAWTPDLANGEQAMPDSRSAPPAAASGPSIFTAVREQLGLRLEPGQGPVKGVVIERIDRPTPN